MDWLSDFVRWLDPAWVTACVAVVAGIYTVINVHTARKAYVEGVEHRKVAQARLVWGTVGVHVGKWKGAKVGDMGRKILRIDGPTVGDSQGDYELQIIDGQRESVTTRDLTIHAVRVTNNSAEPIGRLRLRLSGYKPHWIVNGETIRPPKPWRWEHSTTEVSSVIPPGETRLSHGRSGLEPGDGHPRPQVDHQFQ